MVEGSGEGRTIDGATPPRVDPPNGTEVGHGFRALAFIARLQSGFAHGGRSRSHGGKGRVSASLRAVCDNILERLLDRSGRLTRQPEFRCAGTRRRRWFSRVARAEGWVKARHGDQREPRPEHRERSDRPRSRSERVPSTSERRRSGGAVRNLPPAKSNLRVEKSDDRGDSEGVFKSW